MLLRFQIEPLSVKDNWAYENNLFRYISDGPALLDAAEPYKVMVFEVIEYISGNFDQDPLTLLVSWNFVFMTFGFLVMARSRKMPKEIKVIFFALFYFPIVFVWMRAGPAYIMFILAVNSPSLRLQKIFASVTPLIHLSAIPVTTFWLTKQARPLVKIVTLFLLVAIFLVLYNSNFANYALGKITRYSETGDQRGGAFHLILVILISTSSLALWIRRKRFGIRPHTFLLFALYLIAYFINPVVAHRFSVYWMISLLEYEKLKFLSKIGAILLLPVLLVFWNLRMESILL